MMTGLNLNSRHKAMTAAGLIMRMVYNNFT